MRPSTARIVRCQGYRAPIGASCAGAARARSARVEVSHCDPLHAVLDTQEQAISAHGQSMARIAEPTPLAVNMDENEKRSAGPGGWRWPNEPRWLQQIRQCPVTRTGLYRRSLPEGVVDDDALRRAAIANPDEDAPREAYAVWMLGQKHEFAQRLGAFLTAQLRVAQAYRANPRADVSTLRSWRGDLTPVSIPEFRSGDVLRQWLLDDLGELLTRAVVGWPQIYRGFVERVAMRAVRFIEIGEELFRAA